jgi:hypothetical protein
MMCVCPVLEVMPSPQQTRDEKMNTLTGETPHIGNESSA